MAQDAPGGLSYYLCIDHERKDDLARVRTWQNLKVGHEGNILWVKDLDYAQVHSIEIKSLPSKTIFYEQNNKLFYLDSRLPERTVPSVLWTPIDRALPVNLPSFNHNYFGVNSRIAIQLLPAETEAEGIALVTTLTILENYVESAPAIRMQMIRWNILGTDKALLIGKPLLPLPGDVFWQRKDFLLPAGFDFEFPLLTDLIHDAINPSSEYLTLWNQDNSYTLITKDEFVPLSRSSFRLSKNLFSQRYNEQ